MIKSSKHNLLILFVFTIFYLYQLHVLTESYELVPNGDFEQLDNDGKPLLLLGKLVEGNYFELEGANHVLKISPINKQILYWKSTKKIISNEDYVFSFKIKGNKVQSFRFCLWTQLPDKHEPPNGPIFSKWYSGTFDWKIGEIKFKMPDKITRFTIFLDFLGVHPPTESIWIDELSIRPIARPSEFTKFSGNIDNIMRNCIPNGDFEEVDEDGNVLTPWGKLGNGISFELEGVNTILKILPKTKVTFSWQAKPGIVEYNKDYKFSFRIKGEDLENFRFCLWTQLPDKHEPPNGPIFSKRYSGTFDWRKDEVTFKMPENINRFTIFFDGMEKGGTLYVDDLSIEPTDTVALSENKSKDALPSFRGFYTNRDIFMFSHGEVGKFDFKLLNRREIKSEVKAIFSFGQHGQGSEQKREERIVKILPESMEIISYEFKAADFPFGVYDIFARFIDLKSNQEIGNTWISIGICSSTKLRKAKEGEFLYGLDTSLRAAFRDKKIMLWTEYMGVDIIRGGFETWEDRGKNSGDLMKMIDEGMSIYKRYNLRVMLNVDPPQPKSEDWMLSYEDLLTKRISFVERVAKKYPEITYWELGNEPDIGFYNGPKEQYAADFLKLYKAIKNSNKNTVVMNGGFAYDTKNIVTILKNIPNESIDIIAYHGHGPGVNAERSAYEKIRQIADSTGHADKLLVETESGMDARTYEQEEEQAATVIQKIVYAQSKKQPFFMFFRLAFEHPAQYNMTRFEDRRQPRPSILSYRTLVEVLRGFVFSHLVDFNREGLESYIFYEPSTNKRVAVLWVNNKISHSIFLKIGSTAEKISEPEIIDMYGNTSSASVLSDGRLKLEVTNLPKFVRWISTEPDFKATYGHSDLELDPVLEIPVGGITETSITIHNSLDKAIQPKISWKLESDQPVIISMKQDAFTDLKPGEKQRVPVTLRLNEWFNNYDWPNEWYIFTFVSPDVDLSSYTSIPEVVPGKNGNVRASKAFFINNKIDLGKIAGTFYEKAVAFLFAEYYSETEKRIRVGAAADYWMDWYVNGERVYDTLKNGNGAGYYIYSHRFEIPLKKGKNLIAVKVLSGSQGWCLVAGGPKDLQTALGMKTDKIVFSLFNGEDRLAEESVNLKFIHPLKPFSGGFKAMDEKLTLIEKPTGTLDASTIQNLFFKEPDTNKWWKGENDLSAMIWLLENSGNVLVTIVVEDDTYVPAKNTSELLKSDTIGIAISGKDFIKPLYFNVGEVNDTVVITTLDKSISLKAKLNHSDKKTYYYIEIPWTKLIKSKEGFINIIVNDNDAGYIKQHAIWKPDYKDPATPSKWYRIIMP
ncbi:MAG TPA: hypothetical protein PLN24_00790 [Victivallales bacterium]|nr:hypothetical protein [Victivallales bacterium]